MPPSNRILETEWIPMPDGRRLAAKIWFPETDAPAPAILEYLPYRRRDGTAGRDATTHAAFAEAGYVGVRVDINGSGDSDGLFDDEYSELELSDGEAVIAWIAAQPWCSGKVGMIGISWGGFNGLQLAFRRPAALKAIVTVCSTVDRYADDIHFMGGCLLTDNFNWSSQMTAYLSGPPDPDVREDWREEFVARVDKMPFFAADWQGHPARDAYWAHGSVCEDWSAIEAAVLSIGGWNDAYVNAPPALAAQLSAPVRALIGAWEHKYPHIARINPADFHGEVLRWFDRWLKDEPSGADALPAYRAYMTEHQPPSRDYGPRAGRWVAEAAWPSPNIAPKVLHLTKTGLGDAPGASRMEVATPLTIGQAAAYFCPGMRIDNELCGDQAGEDAASASFDTAVLDAPLEIMGRAEARLALTVDKPAAQLCLRLCDVAPDGSSMRVSYRPMNLAAHAGYDRPEPLEPGRAYHVAIPLNHCAHRFKAGHRLRLAISTSYWPVVWPAPEAATVTLDLAECSLILPVRIGGESREGADPHAPGPPRPHPELTCRELRAPASRFESRVEADGTLVTATFDDYGMAENPDHGMIVGSSVAQRFAITPEDPLSAVHEATWRYEYARGDWRVAIDSTNRMTSDATHFHLTRRVRAVDAEGVPIVERDWQEKIARGFL